ncbi:TetR/AcrR family transcriptional regulator [Streptomyces sp. SAI-229]|uniref:TetR/AcrR family transcriptional regulator n=1 Tax=Streptomyces sp. SAI-229 TaxID=3377731 RepID=UPI003C7EAB3C
MSRRTTPVPPPDEALARPLRADAERNRQRIIVTARKVFAQRGLEVTLDDIAREAGLGVGTVYRRFADREALVEAIFETEIQRIIALAEEALKREDAWDGLVHLFMAIGQDFADDRGLREFFLEGAHAETRVASARDHITPAISAVIARAQEDGSLRDDIEPTDFALIQIMLGAATQHTRSVTPDLWRRYLTLILDGLRTHRDAPSPLSHRALTQGELDQSHVLTPKPSTSARQGQGS